MIHCSDCCHIASGGVSRRKDRIRRSDDSPNVEARTGVKMDGIYRIGLRGLSRTALLLAICLLHTVSSQQAPDASSTNTEFFQAQPQSTPYFVRAGEPGPNLPCAATPKYAQDSQYRLIWVKVTQSGSPRIISQGPENFFASEYELETSSCHGCYNLRMRNVSFAEDNGRFYCQLLGPSGFVKDSIVAQVVVLVKPGPPQISGQATGPLREGQLAQLECQSSGGNPPPRITWKFANNTDATALARVRNASDLSSPTVSSLSWPVSYKENNQFLRCFVWNEAMGEAIAPMEALSSRFAVQYSPKVTAGPVNPYSVEDQKEASLFCSADANPPARSYVWTYSSLESGSPSTSPAVNSQNLTFAVTRQHRGIYTCTATNELGNGQESLQLDVQYAPKINFVTGNNNQSSSSVVLVSENQAVSVTCQPDANPTATSVSWTGPNGQTLSDNAILSLRSVTRTEAGNYTCTAKNTLTLYGGGSAPRQGSGVLEVKVKHAPGRAIISESEPAVAGGTANLSCTADDPGAPAAQYRWKAPGQQDFEMIPRAVYTIDNVQLDKAGEYSCLPYNEVGLGTPSSYRLVIYQPAVMEDHLKPEDQKKEGDPYELSCSARGHPAPNITWYKDDEPIAQSGTDSHWTASSRLDGATGDCGDPAASTAASDQCSYKVVGSLKWNDGIKWTDKGYISCRAYNGAGRPAESKTLLRIQHKPFIVNHPSRLFVAAEVGQQAVFECKASANPEALFSWSRGGQQGELTASDSSAAASSGKQYSRSRSKVNQSIDLYEDTLVIKTVEEDDFGDYLCKANNNLGDDQTKFVLQRKTKPLPPTEFKVVDKTHQSLILSWVPGFDGGYDQTFTIDQLGTGLTWNVTAAEATTPSARARRHVGIEKPISARFNISRLAPSFTYSFKIKAWNRLGETEWSDEISNMTEDAPLDSDIKKPDQSVYDSNSNVLEVRPTLDTGKYCLLVYLRQTNGAWQTWDCVDPDSKIANVPPASNMRVRFCNRYTMHCGEPTEVMTGVGTAVPAPIIVAICVAAVVLLALVAVICFCCFRSRRQKQGQAAGRNFMNGTNTSEKNKDQQKGQKKHKKTPSTSNGSSRNGTAKKDYEMETNQARPKAISGPYLTKNTPGPILGLGVDQNTGSSKDSGVFTTSSATNNYPYDSNTARNGNPYIPDPAASMNGQGTYNGNVHHHHGQPPMNGGNGPMLLNRPPSYDGHEHWGATDGYGLASNGGGAYLNGANGHHHPHQQHPSVGGRGHDFHDGAPMDTLNGGGVHGPNGSFYDANTPTSAISSAGPSGFVDPYGAVGFVDMNPNGGGSGHGSGGGDGSMNSGYSTPTQRRVMREIIV